MREFVGNVLEKSNLKEFDALCITSNGTVKKNGGGVMGAGIAKAFKAYVPNIESVMGKKLKEKGNTVGVLGKLNIDDKSIYIIAFPVKHNWFEIADIDLIKKSCNELKVILDKYELKNVALPRPGCGNGKLDWNNVKGEIEGLIDERVIVCSFK